jgi:hypothetical protein
VQAIPARDTSKRATEGDTAIVTYPPCHRQPGPASPNAGRRTVKADRLKDMSARVLFLEREMDESPLWTICT